MKELKSQTGELFPIFIAFVLVILILAIMSLILTGFGQTILQQSSLVTNSVAPSISAVDNNGMGGNLIVMLSGSTGWISGTNPLTLTVTGNSISTYSPYGGSTATPGTSESQTFVLTSGVPIQVISSNTGNFYSLSSITLSGVPSGTVIAVNVVQYYNSTT